MLLRMDLFEVSKIYYAILQIYFLFLLKES